MCKIPPLSFLIIIILCTIAAGDEINTIDNEYPRIKIGFSERLRLVTWDNAITLADSAEGTNTFTRHRTSVMGRFFLDRNIEFGVKLTNEFRYYFVPETRDFDLDEIFFDQLYIKWHNKYLLPGTLTIGRQNIILGEGFVVMEGHPLDGSRSIYFNAVRYDWEINNNKKLTLFYSYQPETDEQLPIIHERDQALVEQPEEGIAAYFEGDFGANNIHAYYIRKNVNPNEDGPQSEWSLNNIGLRLSRPLIEELSVSGEGVYQFGEYQMHGDMEYGTIKHDCSAFAGHIHFDYKTNWNSYLPQTLIGGSFYYSGTDPNTDDIESWFPLFERWPKWSESYIYTMIREQGVAWRTNITSLYGQVKFAFDENLKFNLAYHHLWANEGMSAGSIEETLLGGPGKDRGNLVIGKFIYNIDSHFSGHFLWEWFDPGDFYFPDADSYSWVRAELMYRL